MNRIKFAKPINIFKHSTLTDSEGSEITDYATEPHTIKANIQPKKKRLEASQLGERISEVLIGFTELSSDINFKDGVSLLGESEPTYEVIEVLDYRFHKYIEIKKIGV